MYKFKAKKNPSLVSHSRDYLIQELQAWRELIKGEWPWILMLIAGITLLLAFTRPLPPRDVYLAVGQPGSVFQKMGKTFVPYLAQQGITLPLVCMRLPVANAFTPAGHLAPGPGLRLYRTEAEALKACAALRGPSV